MSSARESHGPFWALRRSLRRDDRASSAMVTFIVGTSAFLISSAVLIHFVAEPPGGTSNLEHAELKARAATALSLLLTTPGSPPTWSESAASIDAVERLGLTEPGTSIRLDPIKFRALANGSFSTESTENGRVDYAEAVRALGLEAYNLHLRAFPLFEPFNASTFGVEGMTDFRVAYVGDWDPLETESSKSERYNLDSLAIDFSNVTRTALLAPGDAYRDDKDDLRNFLVPQLGASPSQTVISAGSGSPKYDLKVIDATKCATVVTIGTCSRTLALADDTDTLGYNKNRELRSVLGLANLSASIAPTLATVTWNELVKNSGDTGDSGWVEVSGNGGGTWRTIATSSSSTLPNAWNARVATITSANCPECVAANEVWVAYHWAADNDATTGTGWLVDDVKVAVGGTTVFSENFESPAYDMLIIGSDVDQNAFTPAEVKNGIRDFVEVHGGRLLVLGGQTNTNWLQPLFHVGIRESSPGVASPDTTHPMLTIPNQLDWASYDNEGKSWDFSANGAEDLFSMVVGSGEDEHVLSISAPGAFGESESDGLVMLTTYLPHTMEGDEAKGFFANALTYGRYHRLYMEVGPEVPTNIPVAAASRTATMDMTVVNSSDYIEMTFILYVWPGTSSAVQVPFQMTPRQPADVAASAASNQVTLTWNPPTDPGASAVEYYHVYRGTMSGTETFLVNTSTATTGYVDSTVVNGQTYYYNITAGNAYGTGSSSVHVSATPATVPGVPQSVTVTDLVPGSGLVRVAWSAPASNGGAAVNAYNIYRSADNVTYTFRAATSTTSYDNVTEAGTWWYKVSANNSRGEGAASVAASVTTATTPGQPLAPSALNTGATVTLAWLAPTSDGGSPVTGYHIYRSTSSGAQTWLATTGAVLTYEDTTVISGTTYYYNVTAANTYGQGPSSAEFTVTTPTATPSAPLLPTATNLGIGQGNRITWTAPATGGPLTGYHLYRGTASGGLTWFATLGIANVSFDDKTAITTNVTYYYNITAANAYGNGTASTEVSAKAPGVPNPPASFSTTGVPGIGVQLTWTAPSNGGSAITGYKIYWGATPGSLAYLTTTLTTGYTHTVSPGTYYYKVTAVNALGESTATTTLAGTRAI